RNKCSSKSEMSSVHSLASSFDSNLSVSVGLLPCEEPFSCESTVSCENTSSTVLQSTLPLLSRGHGGLKIQGLLGRRDPRQDDWEQFCKLSITLAWDVDVASDSSDLTANWDLSRDNRQIDKQPKEKTQPTLSKLENLLENQKDDDNSVFPESAQEEDSQLPSSSPPGTARVSRQDLAKFNPPESDDVIQFAQIPPRLQEHDQRTRTAESSSVSTDPPAEGAPSSTQALSCLNFGWVFWLRHQVVSSLWGREHPKKATKSPHLLAKKKRLSHRSKRIQPQESLELGHRKLPYF
uniref:Uncharacterized protein n=1 Tax=Catagonus wagneri TaxID=51154 RepID=A0A8C3X888_9CETA